MMMTEPGAPLGLERGGRPLSRFGALSPILSVSPSRAEIPFHAFPFTTTSFETGSSRRSMAALLAIVSHPITARPTRRRQGTSSCRNGDTLSGTTLRISGARQGRTRTVSSPKPQSLLRSRGMLFAARTLETAGAACCRESRACPARRRARAPIGRDGRCAAAQRALAGLISQGPAWR
jgi:hypothetical protein